MLGWTIVRGVGDLRTQIILGVGVVLGVVYTAYGLRSLLDWGRSWTMRRSWTFARYWRKVLWGRELRIRAREGSWRGAGDCPTSFGIGRRVYIAILSVRVAG